MISAVDVTACLVTRGDVSMDEIVDSLPFERVIIYDNSREPDYAVYGRYVAAARAASPFVFFQDDDCILDPETFDALLDAHEPGHVTCNMPQKFRDTGAYTDTALIGFGAITDTPIPSMTFDRWYHAKKPAGTNGEVGLIQRECDLIITGMNDLILVDGAYSDREFASDATRLWKQPDHAYKRKRMLDLVRIARDAA